MAKTIDAKLRISAETAQAVRGLQTVRDEIRNVGERVRGPGGAARGLEEMRNGAASLADSLNAARRAAIGFLGVQLGTQGLSALASMADAYAGLSARLRIAASSQADFAQALKTSRDLAQQYQGPLDATATLYTRILSAVRPLGGGLREAAVTTEALLAALRISGASASETASAILQLSQALASGRLAGEEFNAIAEAAPRLLDALAEGLGKPRSELKALAEQGALTTGAIVKALSVSLPGLQREASKLPATVGGSMQQLRDAIAEVVGKAAEGSRGIAALTEQIRALASSASVLVDGMLAVATVFAAVKAGQLAAGLVSVTAGAVALGGALPALVAGLRALWAVVGGPVGLVVAVTSLAIAWDSLDKAKAKVSDRSAERVRAERDAVQRQLDELANERRRLGVAAGPGLAGDAYQLQAKLNRLNVELRSIERAAEDAMRQGKPRGNPGTGVDLLDPRTVADFEKDYRTRQQIEREFAEKRAAYIVAKDKEIAAAQLAGNAELVRRLTLQKTGALAQQAKEEREALRRFDADQTVTRLATYREHYDRLAELASDATARALKENQSRFDQELRSAREYFAERARLEEEASEQTINKLRRELEERERVLAANQQAVRKASTANDRAAAQDAVTQATIERDRVLVEIERAQRDQADARTKRNTDEQLFNRQLEQQLQQLELQTRELNGQLTIQDLRLRAERQFAEIRRRELAETGQATRTDALIDAQTRVQGLQLLMTNLRRVRSELSDNETAIDEEVSRGVLSIVEGERKKFEARAAALPQMEELISKMRELAATPEESDSVRGAERELERLKRRGTEIEETLRRSISGSFSKLFTDVATGARSASDAFKGFIAEVASAALNLIAQDLGRRIAESLAPNGGVLSRLLDSSIGFLAGLFHDGGIVGQGGSTRAIPASLAAAGAQFAPRYHSGGIAGLAPWETLAVLKRGEEVLPADSPRHVRNFAGSGLGGVQVNVTVNGAAGSQADLQRAGGALAGAVNAAIDAWAARESRPGGTLYRL